MTSAEARTAVKDRMGIASGTTTFDTLIDGFVLSGVRRLYPRASLEVASQEVDSFTVDNLGECIIDITALSTPILAARKVEAYDATAWHRVTDTYHHAGSLVCREISDDITKFRIYGLTKFASVDEVQDWLLQAVIWYSMAEFYDYLAGNKKNYNIYMQSTGARAVDNMADQSAYYDAKADRYIEEQNQVYGL